MKYLHSLGRAGLDVLISLALMGVGWGLDDLMGLVAHPARALFILALVAQALYGSYAALRITRDSAVMERDKIEVQRVGLGLMEFITLEIIFVLGPYCDRRALAVWAESAVVRYGGVGLYAAGLSLLFWNSAFLGRYFSIEVTAQSAPRLITTGLYRYIRHPMHLGRVLYALGLALVFRSWICVAAVGYLLVVSIRHIQFAEALQQEQFGYRWADYCATSWRLIPFIY